jgi:L-2,4-diaminobutyric acid acetyltransferase
MTENDPKIRAVRPAPRSSEPRLRRPTAADGEGVWTLIAACAPLDRNSLYCNLIQCDHFAETCVVAELDGEIVGWVSGHIPPNEPDTLFVWQVAVGEAGRGKGLAKKMLNAILERPVCENVDRVKTTITKDNRASWGLFGSFAADRDAPLVRAPHFTREGHFGGRAETEHLVRIGPFGALAEAAA